MLICVDSNVLRKRDQVATLIDRAESASGQVVLPYAVVQEMIGHADWREGIRLSVANLRARPELVSVMEPVSFALEREVREGVPSRVRVSGDLTAGFRKLVMGMDFDGLAAAVVAEIAEIKRLRERIPFIYPHREDASSRLREFAWSGGKSPPCPFEEWVSACGRDCLDDLVGILLEANGIPAPVIGIMANSDSTLRRLAIAIWAYHFHWAVSPGYRDRSDEIICNDHFDQDIVVAGTYCDETITHDKLAKSLDVTLRALLSRT